MNRVYRYPAALRATGLFGSMLAGGILLGSVLAEIEAAHGADFMLHLFGAIVGAAILWPGLEFGLRRIDIGPEGVTTRLFGERKLGREDVRDVRDGPLSTLIIAPKRGLPIVIWPYLENFGALIDALRALTPR